MIRRDILKMGAGLAAVAATGRTVPAGAGVASAEFADKRRVATLSQGDIAYVEVGDGPGAAIFLHGWPLNGFHWRDSIAVLSKRRRCIAPDFMGLGYSEVTAGQDLAPQAQADMILGLMDALGVASTDIVANDSGTGVAQFLAASHPHRVDSLLLSNGDAHTNSPPEALRPALEAARNGSLADLIARHLAEPGFSGSALGLGHICYTDPANLTEEAMRTYFTPLLATSLRRAQFQQYGVAFEPNRLPAIEGQLKAYRGPVRMIWGTGDVHFAFEWAEWLDRTFPASRGIRKVDGAKLFFTEERPDIVIEEAGALWA